MLVTFAHRHPVLINDGYAVLARPRPGLDQQENPIRAIIVNYAITIERVPLLRTNVPLNVVVAGNGLSTRTPVFNGVN